MPRKCSFFFLKVVEEVLSHISEYTVLLISLLMVCIDTHISKPTPCSVQTYKVEPISLKGRNHLIVSSHFRDYRARNNGQKGERLKLRKKQCNTRCYNWYPEIASELTRESLMFKKSFPIVLGQNLLHYIAHDNRVSNALASW